MKTDVLPEPTKRLLEKFGPDNLPPGTYLARGTAIALWIGHRQSVDLDWFTTQEFDEKMWQMKWEAKLGFSLRRRDWQTLIGEIESVKRRLAGRDGHGNAWDWQANYINIKEAYLRRRGALPQ